MRLLGLDPGLRNTGWGIVDAVDNRLSYVADGTVRPKVKQSLAYRLRDLHEGLAEVLALYGPDEAAVEETFVNKNPESTLKLGEARGVVVLAPALAGLVVAEYSANRVKKSVVGAGHATNQHVQMMVSRLLPGCEFSSADSADALAVAICHAHFAETNRRLTRVALT
jgi:crossover junction endodeoxyribonuclease RuvC